MFSKGPEGSAQQEARVGVFSLRNWQPGCGWSLTFVALGRDFQQSPEQGDGGGWREAGGGGEGI